MMQPMKAVATVSSALRLMHFFISPSEIEIVLRELESLPIFVGLKERSDMKFIPRPGGKIKTQLDLAYETICFQMSIFKCVKKLPFFDASQLADLFAEKLYEKDLEELD